MFAFPSLYYVLFYLFMLFFSATFRAAQPSPQWRGQEFKTRSFRRRRRRRLFNRQSVSVCARDDHIAFIYRKSVGWLASGSSMYWFQPPSASQLSRSLTNCVRHTISYPFPFHRHEHHHKPPPPLGDSEKFYFISFPAASIFGGGRLWFSQISLPKTVKFWKTFRMRLLISLVLDTRQSVEFPEHSHLHRSYIIYVAF